MSTVTGTRLMRSAAALATAVLLSGCAGAAHAAAPDGPFKGSPAMSFTAIASDQTGAAKDWLASAPITLWVHDQQQMSFITICGVTTQGWALRSGTPKWILTYGPVMTCDDPGISNFNQRFVGDLSFTVGADGRLTLDDGTDQLVLRPVG